MGEVNPTRSIWFIGKDGVLSGINRMVGSETLEGFLRLVRKYAPKYTTIASRSPCRGGRSRKGHKTQSESPRTTAETPHLDEMPTGQKRVGACVQCTKQVENIHQAVPTAVRRRQHLFRPGILAYVIRVTFPQALSWNANESCGLLKCLS